MQICAYLFSTLPHLYQTCATATPPLILCNHRHLCQIRVTTAPLSKPCHRCTFANPLRPPHLRQTRATTAPPSVLCNHRRPSSVEYLRWNTGIQSNLFRNTIIGFDWNRSEWIPWFWRLLRKSERRTNVCFCLCLCLCFFFLQICWCLVVTTLSNGGWWFLVGMLRTFAWTLMGGYGVLL